MDFTNRTQEFRELDSTLTHGGLLVVFGRRRVGKTRLLTQWLKSRSGLYSQAIEGAMELQVEQVFQDIRSQLDTSIVPKNWHELLEIVALQKKKVQVLCLDEFPYLVASDPSLPSVLQRWLDHSLPKNFLLILTGSSNRMMHDFFLNRSAPLYGRARKILHVEPMGYVAFCSACKLNPDQPESFERFALVGGIPKYWEFVSPRESPIQLAEELFFGFAPYLEQEPMRILRDEGVAGMNALSILEAIGRGAEKPSEIAARLATPQTNLSRLLQQLLDASLLEREIPFGESLRSSKKTLYRIQDPTLRFWFRAYSPHRSRWQTYSADQKAKLIHDHASTVFEDVCRKHHPGATRYWERTIEFDFVRTQKKSLVVTEVKWRKLTSSEKAHQLHQLKTRFSGCALAVKYADVVFEVLDAGFLDKLHNSTG